MNMQALVLDRYNGPLVHPDVKLFGIDLSGAESGD